MNKNLKCFYKFMIWGGKVISHKAINNTYTFTIETDDVIFINFNRFLTPDFLTGRIIFTLSPGKTKARNI